MNRERFAGSPVGRLVRIAGTDGRTGTAYEHVAFQPDPLGAGEPDLPGEAWRLVVLRAFHHQTTQRLAERRRALADTVARGLQDAAREERPADLQASGAPP